MDAANTKATWRFVKTVNYTESIVLLDHNCFHNDYLGAMIAWGIIALHQHLYVQAHIMVTKILDILAVSLRIPVCETDSYNKVNIAHQCYAPTKISVMTKTNHTHTYICLLHTVYINRTGLLTPRYVYLC